MSLYLKYRPITVDQLDLDGVRAAFNDLIKANTVSHAYLFTGPRGAGKTSSARILARIVNCEHNDKKLAEPCNECESCLSILKGGSLDFVEIDAASNRGIDDIRELKEKIRLAPSDLKYKVYIIDEVHMLTTEAFNALLKTLEEPPAHAIFVLCTTETHKVPETIKSRCQQISFTKAKAAEMKRSFARVINGEGKKVTEEALDYLAKSVDGSFRDGVKILEKVLQNNEGVIELSQMEEAVVGVAGVEIRVFVEAILSRDTAKALEFLDQSVIAGVDLTYLVVTTMKALRDQLLSGADLELVKLIFALDEVARKIATSPVPELLLQVVLIEWGGGVDKRQAGKAGNQGGGKIEPAKASEKIEVQQISPSARDMMGEHDHNEIWQKLLDSLNGDSITLGALLSKARPAKLSGDILTINVAYEFHREQIMSDRVLKKLEAALERAVGRPVRVVCEVGAVETKGVTTPNKQGGDTDDTIDEAIAIFS